MWWGARSMRRSHEVSQAEATAIERSCFLIGRKRDLERLVPAERWRYLSPVFIRMYK